MTIFVTGSDTGIGKTYVAGTLARLLAEPNRSLALIKPVETGRLPGERGDIDQAASLSGLESIDRLTLFTFAEPTAPLKAAKIEQKPLSIDLLIDAYTYLPPHDLRIVEGAGGLAVPLDSDGRDWCDFAKAITADLVLIVVADRLGAIHQGRVTAAYAKAADLPAYIWLNETKRTDESIRESNAEALANLLIARQRYDEPLPENPNSVRAKLLR